jgi:hypothetical protein
MMPVKIPALVFFLLLPFWSFSQDFLKKDYFLHDTTEIHTRLEMSEPQKQLLGILSDTETEKGKTSAEISGDGYISQSATGGNNRNFSQNTVSDFKVSSLSESGVKIEAEVQNFDMPVDDLGATDQVSELNNFKIGVSKDSTALFAGDIFVRKEDSEILNFSKKIRGLNFLSVNPTPKKRDTLTVESSFSETKGKFLRVEFYGFDNSQGPYYLKPKDSLTSVIILRETEKIFLDDRLLTSDEDYTIDYNSGSVVFANKHIISAQSKITAEFEYTETAFENYFLYAQAGIKRENSAINIGYVSEFDGIKNLTDTTQNKPQKKDFLFLTFNRTPEKKLNIKTETVLSKQTKNRLTTAGENSAAEKIEISRDFLKQKDKTLSAKVFADYFSGRFSSVSEYKDTDFSEVWQTENYEKTSAELFYGCGLEYGSEKLKSDYKIIFSDIKNFMKGCGNIFNINYTGQKNITSLNLKYYENTRFDTLRQFFYGNFSSVFHIKKYDFGAEFTQKDYRDFSVFFRRNFENGGAKLSATDRKTSDGGFSRFLTLDFSAQKKDFYRLKMLEILKTSNNNYKSLSSEIESFIFLINKQLRLNTNYNSHSGQSEEIAYKFIKTTPGNGYFTWRDYNGDGIEDLNEFEKSYYKTEADYVKYFIHTGKFVNTTNHKINFSANFSGKETNKKISFLLSRLILSYNIKAGIEENFNKNFSQNFSSKIFLFCDLWTGCNFFDSQNNTQTMYGSEEFFSNSKSYFLEKKLGKTTLKQQYTKKISGYFSEFFTEKNYRLTSHEHQSTIQKDFANGLSPSADYTFKTKIFSGEKAFQNFFSATLNYKTEEKGSFVVSAKYVLNKINSTVNQSVIYQISEGLNAGGNFVINITSSYKLSKHLFLNLDFETRKPQTSKAVITGTAELKAVL